MAITVEKAENYRTCNVCASENKVINITFMMDLKNSQQGNQVALCEKCAKRLTWKLFDFLY